MITSPLTRRRLSLFAVGAFASSLLVPALTFPQAAGAEPVMTAAQAGSLARHLAGRGLSVATQQALLAKIQRGEPLDAFGAAEPSTTVRTTGSDRVTTMTYPDGSIRTVTLHGAADSRTGLSECGNAGGWKVNCKVSVWDPISTARFFIDYQTSGSGSAKVRSFHGATCGVVGGSCSLPAPKGIARATQSSAGPAWARLSYQAKVGPISASGEFGLHVSGTSVRVY